MSIIILVAFVVYFFWSPVGFSGFFVYTCWLWPLVFLWNLVLAIFRAVKCAQAPEDQIPEGSYWESCLWGEPGKRARKNIVWAAGALFMMTGGLAAMLTGWRW